MATEVKVKFSNSLEKQNAIFSSLEFSIRASKSLENQFRDENFSVRKFEVKAGLYLDICEAFGIEANEIALLGVFVIDYDYETMGKNVYRFNLQIGEDFIADMSCFMCANADGFTEKVAVSFGSLETIESINASLQIVLITK